MYSWVDDRRGELHRDPHLLPNGEGTELQMNAKKAAGGIGAGLSGERCFLQKVNMWKMVEF